MLLQSKLQNGLVFHFVLAINCNDAYCRRNISYVKLHSLFVFPGRLSQIYNDIVEIRRETKSKVKQQQQKLIIILLIIIVIILIIVAVGLLKNALFRTWRSLNFPSFLFFHFYR